MSVEILKSSFARDTLDPGHPHEAAPLHLKIDGDTFVVSKLSAEGVAVVHSERPAEAGRMLQTTMVARCDGFDLSVPSLWEVVSYAPERSALTLHLAPINEASRLATAQTLIQAIVAGEVLSASDVLDISRRSEELATNSGSYQSFVAPATRAVQRRIGAIVFVILATALLGFVAVAFVNRTLIVQADGTIANARSVIGQMPETAELVAYTAPIGTRVRPNASVAIVKTKAGQTIPVASSCDCVVTGHLGAERATLGKGAPVVQLVPVNGANKALLSIPLDDLRRVRVGDRVTATFYDSDAKVRGTVERVSPPKVLGGSVASSRAANGTVEVRFTSAMPAWRVGEPIVARISLWNLNPLI